jgi:primosomal protein N' (replication factor Y)
VAAAARQERSSRVRDRPPRGRRGAPVAAASLPVARVAVDVPLPHLDRPFDYLVPESLADTAVAGCRVRVRFAGRLTGGYLLDRAAASDHPGGLAFLERVVSPEPVLSAEIAGLARAVADRYGGTLADVLRLAIPPRHAAVEAGSAPATRAGSGQARSAQVPGAGAGVRNPGGSGQVPGAGAGVRSPGGSGQVPGAGAGVRSPGGSAQVPGAGAGVRSPGGSGPVPAPGPWTRYPAGASFLAALADGRAPRAVWSALPGPYWPEEIARAAAAAAASGRGALVVVPDARDLHLIDAALASALGPGHHVSLAAQLGPAERYRRWLAVARGDVRVAAGTRSAMFAPVANLGLVVIWDDGDDLHAEPRAPYPHAREVLALRAHRCGAAALVGGFARTAEAAQLVASGWARSLEADRATVRRCAPTVRAAGSDRELARDEAARTARLPSLALRTAREALGQGPVLFQVPRRGYVAAVSCERCHAMVRCERCGGPVTLPGAGETLRCGWCASAAASQCASCGHSGIRAQVTGAGRTAEELGRAFPSVPVRTSGGSAVVAEIPAGPAVIVATPGAEPLAAGGYAAAVLLDGWALLGRASLRAAEEALRRWMNAAALVRPGSEGGCVVVVAESELPVVQALVRWDPAAHADRELAERRELRFPPAACIAAVTGPAAAVRDLLIAVRLPDVAEVLGPVPVAAGGGHAHGVPDDENLRFLIRVPRSAAADMAAALRAGQGVRSARRAAGSVRLQLDPAELI